MVAVDDDGLLRRFDCQSEFSAVSDLSSCDPERQSHVDDGKKEGSKEGENIYGGLASLASFSERELSP